MYIKMNDDKSLVVTIPTTIYRGERNADLITFLVPAEYEGKNMADCTMSMKYILPTGSGRTEALVYQPEMYKSYLQYSTPVNTRFTEEDGDLVAWLTASDLHDNVILKTGEVVLPISESKNTDDYRSEEEMDQLERIEAALEELQENKADNIIYDAEEHELQLVSNGTLIGDPVDIGDRIEEIVEEATSSIDDVIYFEGGTSSEDESDDSDGSDDSSGSPDDSSDATEDESDDVIYF